MDLEELRAFLAVADTGSLVAAAKTLQMSRPTLRRRIDQLEARAGVPLLERSRRGAALTAAGAELAARGCLLVQEASALVTSIRMTGAEPAGTLRILLPSGLPPTLPAQLYAFVCGRYPRLDFELRFADDPAADLLVDVDVAFHFGDRSPEGPWRSRELARVPVVLVAATPYLERRGRPTTAAELAQHDLFAWRHPDHDGRAWPLAAGGALPVAPKLVARDAHLLRQLALAGHGIALVPEAGLPDPHAPLGPLERVLPGVVGSDVAMRVVVPSALVDVPRVRAVIDLLRPFLGAQGLGARDQGAGSSQK
ncbi:MAG: LysR family transcriptional regulator [Myxococcales bacterium]|nr:LysR family transcriptional regulator [Myxococcales bacterium]